MKRFRWPLQRLLEVTERREQAHRAELMRLSAEMAACRQAQAMSRRLIQSGLDSLAELDVSRRAVAQELVMRQSAVVQRRLDTLATKMRELNDQRQRKIDELIQIRKKRQTYEKLREQARRQHLASQLKVEQKQLDESAQVAFAAKAGRRTLSVLRKDEV